MTSPEPSPAVQLFRQVMQPEAGSGARAPGWLLRPGPPSSLRDAPCRRRPDLFEPTPIRPRSPDGITAPPRPRSERQELAYRLIRAKRICNGAPGYDEPCPLRMTCLAWALDVQERVVAGGVVVTLQMIKGYHLAKEVGEHAPEETATPEDWAGELAKRARRRQRQPEEGARGRRERESA